MRRHRRRRPDPDGVGGACWEIRRTLVKMQREGFTRHEAGTICRLAIELPPEEVDPSIVGILRASLERQLEEVYG